MKKIILGLGLEQRTATCSFCGENDKNCVKGSVPLVVDYYEKDTESKRVIENFSRSFFTGRKIIKDYDWREVVKENRFKTKTNDADICKDCITQLHQLLK